MESYIRQIQSLDVANNVKSDTSKRKREDYGLEDIRIRVENLLGLASELVNRDKSRYNKISQKQEESKSFDEHSMTIDADAESPAVKTPSRIPRRSNSIPVSRNSEGRSRSATPQRIVQSRIQYFEALSQNKDVFKTILSQERELGIQRTSIPISVKIKATNSLNFDKSKVPVFGQLVTTAQEKSVFVFAAPTPVRGIPRFVGANNAAGSTKTGRNIPIRNYNLDTPSKIPLLDKSKYFAGDSRILINRKTG